MSNEHAERLRELGAQLHSDEGAGHIDAVTDGATCPLAADEIDRLTRERDEARRPSAPKWWRGWGGCRRSPRPTTRAGSRRQRFATVCTLARATRRRRASR